MFKTRRANISPAHRQYLLRVRLRQVGIWGIQIALLVAFFLLWEVAANRQWIDSFLISQPSRIWQQFNNMVSDGTLYFHAWTTIWETVVGFSLGTVIGVLIAIGLWWSPFWSRVLDPYIVVLNSVPKVALGPIFIVWLGSGVQAIIAMALAISVIVTVMMVHTGFKEVDPNKVKLLRTFGANKLQILWKVILPSSIPVMIAALKVNVGLALVGTIVGEFLVSKAGLGFLIVYGGQVFRMTLIMTSVLVLCVVSVVLYYLVNLLEQRLVRWKE